MTELLIIVVILLVFIGWQEWRREKERQEFFEYVKARDLWELKNYKEKPEKKGEASKVEMSEIMPLEQATDEQFDMAIKKELGREPLIEKVKERMKHASR